MIRKKQSKKKKPEPRTRPGPEPTRLNIEGDVGDAVSRILGAGKPPAPKKRRATRAKRTARKKARKRK